MSDNITIFVSSCDKNEDIWPVFFKVLSSKWNEAKKLPIVLNTETKEYRHKDFDITCPRICREMSEEEKNKYAWSDRCKESLKYVKTKYCLFLLDDFLLVNHVDQHDFLEFMEEVDSVKKFACVYFCGMRSLYPNQDIVGKKYLKSINPFSDYKAQMCPGLWNTSLLKRLIAPNLNVWQAELKMRDRSYLMGGYYKYFALQQYELDTTPFYQRKIPDTSVLCYDFRMQMVKGKWVESLADYLDASGIKVDYEKRGFAQHDFDSNAKTYIQFKDRLMEKGNGYYTVYMCFHNFIIPTLSNYKWKLINLMKRSNIRKRS